MLHHSIFRCLSGAFLGALAMASLQGCRRTDMVSTWVPPSPASTMYVEDGVLASRVRAALILSPVQHSIDINIESHQGVVLLSGTAADKTQMDVAVFVAQTVPSVNRVDSVMFSTGAEPATANLSSYAPSLDELRARRLLQSTQQF
ncbi:transport-associated protein [Acidovorax delafieldii 2AN]|uniref:Transport-associated protein n=1 Tax=Acidovorax delafieldii 2AN TaxID=573060 RepID=C5SZZ0_ACIDE|nr:BON domain-containing protein [Acidovorax delafieldii]EER62306.1 transport-associated protein [Acidovorax delafieldii 2AN]